MTFFVEKAYQIQIIIQGRIFFKCLMWKKDAAEIKGCYASNCQLYDNLMIPIRLEWCFCEDAHPVNISAEDGCYGMPQMLAEESTHTPSKIPTMRLQACVSSRLICWSNSCQEAGIKVLKQTHLFFIPSSHPASFISYLPRCAPSFLPLNLLTLTQSHPALWYVRYWVTAACLWFSTGSEVTAA